MLQNKLIIANIRVLARVGKLGGDSYKLTYVLILYITLDF